MLEMYYINRMKNHWKTKDIFNHAGKIFVSIVILALLVIAVIAMKKCGAL